MYVTGMSLSSLSLVCVSCRGGSSQVNGTFCSCNSGILTHQFIWLLTEAYSLSKGSWKQWDRWNLISPQTKKLPALELGALCFFAVTKWMFLCFRLPFTFVTKEVADATCECLLAQAEQAEKTGKSKAAAERMILEEFGRCLMRVISSAGKSKGDPCAMNCWLMHMSHNEADWTEHLRHRDTLV